MVEDTAPGSAAQGCSSNVHVWINDLTDMAIWDWHRC